MKRLRPNRARMPRGREGDTAFVVGRFFRCNFQIEFDRTKERRLASPCSFSEPWRLKRTVLFRSCGAIVEGEGRNSKAGSASGILFRQPKTSGELRGNRAWEGL
jgi:hypothetical protein